MLITQDLLEKKYSALKPILNERAWRLLAAAEARSLGRGGIEAVAHASGLSRRSVERGLQELKDYSKAEVAASEACSPGRSRRAGAGRKTLRQSDPGLLVALEQIVDPVTRGDPMSPLRWTSKSTAKLARELTAAAHPVSARSVASLLIEKGYSLQSVRKSMEGGKHEDRNAQFQYINASVQEFQARGEPVISVDAKKKELVGSFANRGREWQPKSTPELVNVYDFPDKEQGKAIPYGVYDLAANEGWVSVGIDHDTAEFAGESILRWWREMGQARYPAARRLLITADGGGSNGVRVRLWKKVVQQFATRTGLEIHVRHFPPGTSKWNKIEHRMSCQITQNWRGRPLSSRQVIVQLIGNTTSQTGLKIRAELDEGAYPTAQEVDEEEMAAIKLKREDFHGEWNYSILP